MEETAEEQKVRADCIAKITELKKKLDGLKEAKDPSPCQAAAQAKGVQAINPKFKERRKLDCLGKVADIAWAPDSKNIATATQDGKLIIWNAFTKNKDHFVAQSSWFLSCDYSPDGKLVAVAGLDNLCTVHPMPEPGAASDVDPKPVAVLEKHLGYIGCNKFLSQTEMLTSSGDKTIILWDIKKQQALVTLTGHYGDACCVDSISGETNTFISASSDGTAKLWDRRAAANCCVMTYQGHKGGVNKVKWLPNKQTFATLGEDSSARLWDIRSHQQISVLQEEGKEGSNPGLGLDCSKTGRMLFCGYTEGVVLCWDTLTGEMAQEMANHSDAVTGVGVSPDGKAVACCSRDSFTAIWA